MLLTGVSWQIWVFLATAFPTVWLIIHSTEIPQPSLNHPSTSPRPLDFYQEKKSALGLVFSVILCPISRSREMWDGCNCHAGHEEDRPTGSAPCQLYTAPLHFLSLQIPCLHACHLRQQVGTSANVSVSKHRSGWNVIVQSLWLASLFFGACS